MIHMSSHIVDITSCNNNYDMAKLRLYEPMPDEGVSLKNGQLQAPVWPI